MGFWHTGYMEFHEETGLDYQFAPREAPTHRCPLCDASFASPEGLRQHRLERHPYIKPVLFLRCVELGATSFHVSRPISAKDIAVSRCTSATVNGRPIALNQLGVQLASYDNDRVRVELVNEGTHAVFDLVFGIASEPDLKGVEACFLSMAKARHLDARAIESFISSAQPYSSAIQYCDAICHYLYGILAKERAANSSLPYEAYRDKFNQAAHALSDIKRPLADAIRALVAFHFNHFGDAEALLPNSRLALAAKRYNAWMVGMPDPVAPMQPLPPHDRVEDLLTDFETVRLLNWALIPLDRLREYVGDIQSVLTQDLPDYDRVKIYVLLAEHSYFIGDHRQASRMARELMNNPTTSGWAQQLIDRSGKATRIQ